MSVTIKFHTYTELCAAYSYGREIDNLSEEARNRLDDLMDGMELDFTDDITYHPDNLVVNGLVRLDVEELVVGEAEMLSQQEWDQMKQDDTLHDWLEEHREEMEDWINEEHYLLDLNFGRNEVVYI